MDSSPISSPIVPLSKPDGSVRICGDYKHTLNPILDTKQYPLPTTEECFYPMKNGDKYSKIDIRAAYNHLKLREKDQILTTIATPQGLFKWSRLPFGVSSATAIFQNTMDQVLDGLEKVVCRVDDILVTGCNDEEHMRRITEVIETLRILICPVYSGILHCITAQFERLYNAGFCCRLDKSEFLKSQVVYLDHKISKEGVSPRENKIRTLTEAPYPQSVAELISFLGAVDYYAKFIPNLSSVVDPLN